jgi:hypothetical protein
MRALPPGIRVLLLPSVALAGFLLGVLVAIVATSDSSGNSSEERSRATRWNGAQPLIDSAGRRRIAQATPASSTSPAPEPVSTDYRYFNRHPHA